MPSKKVQKIKSGRKTIDPKKKVKNRSTYLTDDEALSIVRQYGSVTQAVREEVLPKVSTL